MTVAFPDVDPLSSDVLGARPGADPLTDAEAIEIALQPDGEEPQVFSLSVCAAYHLREVLDAALEAPFHWDDDGGEDHELLGLALEAVDAMFDPDVIDLARARTVRWDETWAHAHPR